jgi:hypothetical protein
VTGSKARDGQTVGAVLRRVGRPKAGEGNGDDVTISGKGNGPAYLAARLRRDRLEDIRHSWRRRAAYRPEFSSVAPVGVGSGGNIVVRIGRFGYVAPVGVGSGVGDNSADFCGVVRRARGRGERASTRAVTLRARRRTTSR